MARDRANIRTDMLGDTSYRELSINAQHLYHHLMIHPSLTYAGVADWRPGRLAKMSANGSRSHVEAAARELQDAYFIYCDDEAEEVFIRSFVRHDGLLKRHQLPIAMANAYAEVASPEIRRFFIHELKRLREEEPELKAWDEPRVKQLFTEPSQDMKSVVQAAPQAVLHAVPQAMDHAIGHAVNDGVESLCATTTATPTTTPPSGGGSGGRRKPERPLPESWTPSSAHSTYAEDNGINLDFQAERFRNHAQANDRRARDWDAAFRNWLLKAEKSPASTKNPLWDA